MPSPKPKLISGKKKEITELVEYTYGSLHGTFQARVLEWGAIAFSESKVKTPLFYFEPQSIKDAYKRKWLRSSQKKGDGENK